MLVTLLPMVTLVRLSQLQKRLLGIFSTLSPNITFTPPTEAPALRNAPLKPVRFAAALAL